MKRILNFRQLSHHWPILARFQYLWAAPIWEQNQQIVSIECLHLAGLCQNWSFKIYVVANSLHKLDSTSDSKIKRNCIIVSSNNITVASISLNGLFLKNKFILIQKIHIFFCSSFWSKDISYKNSLSYTWIANSFINLFGIYH